MSTFRFALIAVGLFVLAFIGLSWSGKGPQGLSMRALFKADARVQTGAGNDSGAKKPVQEDPGAERDRLRADLLQASAAFTRSPCDSAAKKNLVKALTSYTQAWSDLAFCKPGIGTCPAGSDERLAVADAAFHTPADTRAHDALRIALGMGGIAPEDFPKSLRNHVFSWSGKPAGEAEFCVIAGQTRIRR